MSLDNILRQTAAIEEANKVTLGLRQVHDRCPEELHSFPCSLRYARTGDFHHSRGLGRHNIHHFVIEVHLQRARPGGLAEAERRAIVMIERYQNLYAANLSLNGSCDVSNFELPSYEYGRLEWHGIETFGVRFRLWAKEMLDPITVNL